MHLTSRITLVVTAALLFATTLTAQQGYWYRVLDTSRNGNARDIACADSNNCVAACTFGNKYTQVLKTTDGGVSWNEIWLDSNENFNNILDVSTVAQPTPALILFGTDSGFVFRSSNGGNSWTQIRVHDSLTTTQLPGFREQMNLSMHDSLYGALVATSNPDSIFTTTNGGLTWTPVTTMRPLGWERRGIEDIACLSSTSIICSLNNGEHHGFATSHDFGKSWTFNPKPIPELDSLYSTVRFSFVDDQNGWVLGKKQGGPYVPVYIVRTTDGGTTWTVVNDSLRTENQYTQFCDIKFSSKTNGAISLRGRLARTSDGGSTWTSDSMSVYPNVLSIIGHVGQVSGVAIEESSGFLIYTTKSSIVFSERSSTGVTTRIASYPNPIYGSTSNLTVRFIASHATQAKIDLVSMIGIPMQQSQRIGCARGTNIAHLDVSALPSGTYAIRVMVGDEVHVQTLQVVR